MKNTTKILGIIALVAVIGFSMVACNGDDSAEETVTKTLQKARYLTADAAGNVYELVISEAEGRYVGQQNDGYRLGIWTNGTEAKTRTGTVASVSSVSGGKRYGLKRGNAAAFNVDVSDTWITGISGTIQLDGDTTQEAPASSDLVERGTIANSEGVVYSATFGSDNAQARAINDFSYIEGSGGSGSFVGVNVSTILPNTFFKVINGKVSVTVGTPTNDTPNIETLKVPEGGGITLTPASANNTAKMFRQKDPTWSQDGNYLLACVKTAQTNGTTGLLEYSMLAWTDTEFTMSGSGTSSVEREMNGEVTTWTFTQTWTNCSAKKGWNYYLVKSEYNTSTKTVKETYSVPADSTQPPAGYNWTVISRAKAELLRPYPGELGKRN